MSPSDRILKGRIAETFVSEMLQEAGYFVYRFGYEGILQSLIQKGLPRMKRGDIEAEKIRTMPDFIVMDKEGDVSFIEVKYRANANLSAEFHRWLQEVNQYWPEAKILLVHPKQPHFLVSSIRAAAKTGKFYHLERDKFLQVAPRLVMRYAEVVRRNLR